jgi:hypothetical protein
MKKFTLIAMMSLSVASCMNTKDLTKTLRFSDNTRVEVSKLNFLELRQMKQGKACTYNLLFFPLLGDGSIITAADKAGINNVQITGETGYWVFPIVRNCTVVYGDATKLPLVENDIVASKGR